MSCQTEATSTPEVRFVVPDLEFPCGICDGRGRERDESESGWWVCTSCDGSGLALTEFGEKLMAVVRRHSRSGGRA